MKIIFDNIIFSQQNVGGISIVWYELLKRVLKQDVIQPVFIEYKANRLNHFRKLLALSEDRIQLKCQFLLKLRRYLNPVISVKEKTIFHSSYYRTCNHPLIYNITTVHDFTYERYYKGLAKWLHCQQKYRAILHSHAIICISENTKKDLLEILPEIDQKKIRVIYNGVSEDYFKLPNVEQLQLPFPVKSYVLFVGSRIAYKRFDFAVDVICEENMNLVIVGGGELTSKERLLLDTKLGVDKYRKMGAISGSILNQLYNGANCLLYPSEYEGFGIPVIEAQKAGCPVIAFEGSSVKEIAGNAGLLFSAYDVNLVSTYFDSLENQEFRNEIIDKGLKNADKFSWDKSFNQIMEVYQDAF
jgi:glycosyltransferase involved in cell wall biosynthesis